MSCLPPTPLRSSDRLQLRDGARVLVRAIQAADIVRARRFFASISNNTRYQRWFSARQFNDVDLRRWVSLDAEVELALGAIACEAGTPRMIADARFAMDRASRVAELGLVVADRWQQLGLGTQLMPRLIQAARRAGARSVMGLTLADNQRMRSMLTKFGFVARRASGDWRVVEFWNELA